MSAEKESPLAVSTNRQFISVPEVAERLDLKAPTIKKFIKAGELRGHKMGGVWRVSEKDFADFIDRTSS